jgi:hypothetical protein
MFDAYVGMLRKCPSWSHGNTLGTVLPGIKKLTAARCELRQGAVAEGLVCARRNRLETHVVDNLPPHVLRSGIEDPVLG